MTSSVLDCTTSPTSAHAEQGFNLTQTCVLVYQVHVHVTTLYILLIDLNSQSFNIYQMQHIININCTCLGLVRDNFVIAADSYQKQLYQVDLSTGDVHVIAPDVTHNRPIAVAFDPVKNQLYWTDNDRAEGKAIQRINIEGRQADIVTTLSEGADLLIDWY